MATPFSSGGCDCCLWACDWVLARRGVDPAAPLRGRYRSQAGARRIIAGYGGLEALARSFMASAGLSVTTTPVAGDVGLVIDAAGQQVLAIRTRSHWAAKARRGVVFENFPVIVAWSV